jgi:hypothetical protein
MTLTDGNQPSRSRLPQELRDILHRVDTERLFEELVKDDILTEPEVIAFRKEFGNFLTAVWTDRSYSAEKFFSATVLPDRRRAAFWKIEELFFAPLIERLKDAGLGNDAVLFQLGDCALSAARFDSHATDRIAIKGERVIHRKRLLRKAEVLYEVELDLEYPEKEERHLSRLLEFRTTEEVRQFKVALEKARMIGCFNRFLGRVREMV